jgi:hypothetical protein
MYALIDGQSKTLKASKHNIVPEKYFYKETIATYVSSKIKSQTGKIKIGRRVLQSSQLGLPSPSSLPQPPTNFYFGPKLEIVRVSGD